MPCKCLRPMMRLTVVLSAMAFLPYFALAMRSAPPRVEPAIHDSIRYVAPNDDGRRAYIEAWDVQTNKKLWELTVFANHIEPRLEEDVQWVFINKLNVRDGTLLVTSERGNTYQIDLKTKAITQSDTTKSAMAVMTSSGWIRGNFIPKAAPSMKLIEVSHISVAMRCSWARARPLAR